MGGGTSNEPISRRVVMVGAAVLALTLVAIVVDSRRVRTGELLIQSDRGAIRVAIVQDGRVVAGPTGSRSFVLRPGVYDVEIDGALRGKVTVVRGQRAVLAVP